MKRTIQYIVFVLVSSIVIVFFLSSKGYFHSAKNLVKTDTVYVNKPYKVIEIKEVAKPVRVEVYKRDTVLREKLIQDTLITGIEIKKKEIRIHRLTPLGIVLIDEYNIQDVTGMTLNYEGKLEVKKKKRRKLWRNLERIGLVAGGIWLGNAIKHNESLFL
ncbi:hypothetical protein OAT71_02380 [Flavobacteriales bacterium]|nr:hypothetical protein [Flavobacteriales bacterium]